MVKILVIGDPHGKLPVGLSKIVKKNKIDLIVCAGEVPPVPAALYYPKSLRNKADPVYADNVYDKILDKLCSYGTPVILLKGNAYMSDRGIKITRVLFKKYKNLIHKLVGKTKLLGEKFILFDMIWEEWAYKHLDEKILKKLVKNNDKRVSKLNELFEKDRDSIFVSHNPPYGYLDVVNNKHTGYKDKHVGSKEVLKIIKKYKPSLVLCGHIHEGRGVAKIGKTLVINAGSLGDYVIVDTEKMEILERSF